MSMDIEKIRKTLVEALKELNVSDYSIEIEQINARRTYLDITVRIKGRERFVRRIDEDIYWMWYMKLGEDERRRIFIRFSAV